MEQTVQKNNIRIKPLKSAEANYYELFNKASIAILILEAETGKIIEANDMACQLTGYSKEEFINKHPYDTISSHDCSITKISAAENIRKVMEGCHDCIRPAVYS